MTREEAREAAKVMLAYADGATVQWSHIGSRDKVWFDLNGRSQFDFNSFDYRIKPEPRVVWFAETPDGQLCLATYSETALNNAMQHTDRKVKFIEVID